MKKSDLIHVTVLIAAILLGYSALECLLGTLSMLTRRANASADAIEVLSEEFCKISSRISRPSYCI